MTIPAFQTSPVVHTNPITIDVLTPVVRHSALGFVVSGSTPGGSVLGRVLGQYTPTVTNIDRTIATLEKIVAFLQPTWTTPTFEVVPRTDPYLMQRKVAWDSSVAGLFNYEVASLTKILPSFLYKRLSKGNHYGTIAKTFYVGNRYNIDEVNDTPINSAKRADVRSNLIFQADQSHKIIPKTELICLHCGGPGLRNRGAKFCCDAHKTAYYRARKSNT